MISCMYSVLYTWKHSKNYFLSLINQVCLMLTLSQWCFKHQTCFCSYNRFVMQDVLKIYGYCFTKIIKAITINCLKIFILNLDALTPSFLALFQLIVELIALWHVIKIWWRILLHCIQQKHKYIKALMCPPSHFSSDVALCDLWLFHKAKWQWNINVLNQFKALGQL